MRFSWGRKPTKFSDICWLCIPAALRTIAKKTGVEKGKRRRRGFSFSWKKRHKSNCTLRLWYRRSTLINTNRFIRIYCWKITKKRLIEIFMTKIPSWVISNHCVGKCILDSVGHIFLPLLHEWCEDLLTLCQEFSIWLLSRLGPTISGCNEGQYIIHTVSVATTLIFLSDTFTYRLLEYAYYQSYKVRVSKTDLKLKRTRRQCNDAVDLMHYIYAL